MMRPTALPLIPMREAVIFPQVTVPLGIGRPRSLTALARATGPDGNGQLVLVTQKDASQDEVAPTDLYEVGTLVEILRVLNLPDGGAQMIVRGTVRARIVRFAETEPCFMVEVERLEDRQSEGAVLSALADNLRAIFEKYIQNGAQPGAEFVIAAREAAHPGELADLIATIPEIELALKQQLLEQPRVEERLRMLTIFLTKQNEILELRAKIQGEVQGTLEKNQRDFILREQLRAIQKELGEEGSDLDELREQVGKAGMPDAVSAKALKEIDRLEKTPAASPEQGVIRNYVDWLISLPWTPADEPDLDIQEAKRILDEDHYGLEKVKDRILEYMAVRKLSPSLRSPLLCFVGPPGVGKTSLGKSIARAMGRKFVRMSLGGIRDEAEIRGHRRTYIGSLPGRILQNMKTAGTVNPVFMLDEVDKIGADFRGDPSSALLEVLDPEQNNTFQDHYLEVPYDLSRVVFITTANVEDTIIPPLRDRMEVIRLPGYTEAEKLRIATGYLVPRQLHEHGLDQTVARRVDDAEELSGAPARLGFTEDALRTIIREHTREAGVRTLEREIGTICRKVARRYAEGAHDPIRADPELVAELLGPARFDWGLAEEDDQVGAATGVSVSEHGGDVLTVEVTTLEGKVGREADDLILTGQLGQVMTESARAAVSWVRSHPGEISGLPERFFEDHAVHIHVPAGGIPKDGPSAGVTMVAAVVSALTKRPVRREVAMTGEVTLRGRVLPIGGVKEKLLAAHRAGIKVFVLPEKNKKDLVDVPKEVLDQVEVKLVKDVTEVLAIALAPARDSN